MGWSKTQAAAAKIIANPMMSGKVRRSPSAIADALTESGDGFTLRQLHVRRIPKSAKTPDEMLKMCDITAADIVKETMKMLQIV